jgi:predicted nucleotidyltransferase
MEYGLSEENLQRIIDVFGRFPYIQQAILYCSRAKGNFKNGSDIDITLVGQDLNLIILGKIEWELDDLLLPYTFDLSIFHHISNAELVEHINRVGKKIYESS